MTLTMYSSKKGLGNAVAIHTEGESVTLRMLDDESSKTVTESTLKRWWSLMGPVESEELGFEVLTDGTVIALTETEEVAPIEEVAEEATEEATEEVAPIEESEEASKEVKEKATADKKVEAEAKKAAKKAEAEAKKAAQAEVGTETKAWAVKGGIAETFEEIVAATEGLEITQSNKLSFVVVNGIRRIYFNANIVSLKPADAEKHGLTAETKGYNHPFKGKLTLASTSKEELVLELTNLINLFK